ncbi:MAG: tetratricopeptide repeat protein [Planctomycetota bacterium]
MLLVLLGAAVFLALLRASPAPAESERSYLLGLPWERDVVAGVEEQDRDRRRNKQLDALVREWGLRARRAETVPNLYLLARAYGLRFSDVRDQAEAATTESERERLARIAVGDLGSALSAYADVLRVEPRCYFAHHDIAVLELRRVDRRRRSAFDHLVQALRINEGYVDARRKLVRLYLEGNQQQEAVKQLEVLVRQVPDDGVARVQLIGGLVQVGRHAEAESYLQTGLAAQPDHPAYLDLLAQIQIATGRFDEGVATYRALARANPSMGQPFVGILRALEARREKQPAEPPRFDDYLFALRGLLRLETDPERRAHLEADIRTMEAQRLKPAVAEGAEPTLEQVLQILDSAPDENDRARAIYWVLTRDVPPDDATMRRIARHVGPTTEPAPGVRAVAVRALAEVGGTSTVPIVRLALSDDDARVRQAALDGLVVIGLRDRAPRRALVAVVHLLHDDPDADVAASARLGVLQLAEHRLGLADDADEKAHRAAYRAWLASPEGEEVLARALDGYDVLKDRFADDILGRYLMHESGIVAKAAYDAIGRFVATLPPGDARIRWCQQRPQLDHADFRPEALGATRQRLEAWRSQRP